MSTVASIHRMLSPAASMAGPVTDAALAGDAAEITRLLDEGAEVDEKGIAGSLYFAIQRGHIEAAMLLIDRGADVNRESKFGTPLHIAARKGYTDVLKELLERGADLTASVGYEETTPLHQAAIGGSPALLVRFRAPG